MKTLFMYCVVLAAMGCGNEYDPAATTGAAGREVPVSAVLTGVGPTAAEDTDAAAPLRTESTFCAVTQMQIWVNANYPSAYGWSRSYSGNNGTADLTTGTCGGGSSSYREQRFNAGSCSSGSCTYDVQRCDFGCSGASCYHNYNLKCTCAPNQCQIL
jgi:hypothetical protein